MSVVVSMLSLLPGRMGGSETYARELLRELATRSVAASTLVSPAGVGCSAGVPEVVATGFAMGSSDLARARALAFAQLRPRSLTRLLAGADVVHYPFTVPLPRPASHQRSVVTLHDVQHLDLPHLFSRVERHYRGFAYDRAAQRADAVLTVSDFCKRRIVHHLGIDADRVHVAPLGVRTSEFAAAAGAREEFLLYPAKAWPHKNHQRLFEAFEILRRTRPALRLVLAGATAEQLPPLPAGVTARGLVEQRELVDLYASASALVFPSLYEGFGLPVLEAMSAGCPVAAARAGSLADVVGDAGVLFDPRDPADIARGVQEALDRAAELVPRALQRVKEFTWASCADVHVALYERLGG